VQEAFATALERWPTTGVPPNPGAWITATARNRAIDRLRRDHTLARKTEALRRIAELEALGGDESDMNAIPDDRLRLIFTCCHPALAPEARVALTLRTLGGLTTSEIARAFLTSEPAMAQRLVRAKRKIAGARIPYRVPPPELLGERLPGVLAVLYLIFNEGYEPTEGPLPRAELCEEAIRLARVIEALMPDEPEVIGLLALMLLHHSRRDARAGRGGDLILLEEQDRALWDHDAIDEATSLLDRAIGMRDPGPYQIQAAIASIHARAPRPEDTDWPQIVALYRLLERLAPNPMVTLNHAVAVAMVAGPRAGLDMLATLDADERVAGHHRLDAVRAHLLEMAGDHAAARERYRIAARRTTSLPERRYLEARGARPAAIESRPV
jgi:RNA polymerase sigma-70 factor, ECF subfamily